MQISFIANWHNTFVVHCPCINKWNKLNYILFIFNDFILITKNNFNSFI